MNRKILLRRRGISVLGIIGWIFVIAVIAGLVVPPIQRALAREWAGQMEALIADTVNAQEKYFAANKKYSLKFADLDAQIESPSKPPVSNIGLVVPTEDSVKSFPYYEILINTLPPSQFESVTGVLTAGHYRAGGLTYVLKDLRDGHIPLKKILCFEVDDYRFPARPGGFCEGVLGYKYIYTSKFWFARFYEKPEPLKPAQAAQPDQPSAQAQPAVPAAVVTQPATAPAAKPAPKKTTKKVVKKS
ncbi:MAG: hypothetical protein LBI01_02900 [Elusimicrobium sp.]|jgi:Tfp pilus assembly protein PilE|nr:hypothetical protein [Elusimicrobium sp.]